MNEDDDFFEDETNQARLANISVQEDDPEKAARALTLSDATGVPPTAIYGDVDGFEKQNKAALGSQIIGDNFHIADYINSHPMAARVSHDDLGQLDIASRAVTRLQPESFLERIHNAIEPSQYLPKIGQRLGEVAFPDDPLADLKDFYGTRPTDVEWALQHPAAWSVFKGAEQVLGTPFVIGGKFLSGLTNIVKEFGGRDLAGMLEQEVMKPEGSMLHK